MTFARTIEDRTVGLCGFARAVGFQGIEADDRQRDRLADGKDRGASEHHKESSFRRHLDGLAKFRL